ncbi:MAG: nucleoside triphosphate pyrophosphohydrolase [Bacteroidetes bacterium]|nr:nucleoside triphosphate pyrophosphohydrolase [Bacteroidota bacterium]
MTSDFGFDKLISIMKELREKCPWDKKQTIKSLRQLTIEETFELADAITEEDYKSIKEELGDLLLHIVFYSKIAEEEKKFSISEVIETICEKLISRHPHIYGNVKAETAEEVKTNWEKLKLKEGKKSALEGVPKSLPALVKSMRIQQKAKQVGFEWENTSQVLAKVYEEIKELEDEIKSGNPEKAEEEFGDVLFSLINLSRFLNIDAENALEKTNKKFISRFTKMEEAAAAENKLLYDMSLEEKDNLWNKIKQSN